MKSGKWGIYYRVVQEGHMSAGSEITVYKKHSAGVPLSELTAVIYQKKSRSAQRLRRVLEVDALIPPMREASAQRLNSVQGGNGSRC